MIKKLNLFNFGRFKNTSFEFKPITLFFGYNESGKTTVFDALLDVICKPKKSTTYGKLLNTRYTDTREVNCETEGDMPSMNETDFINLFAIRSGTIEKPQDSNSQWMNKVKASLFTGGLDPQFVASKLNDIITKRGQGTLNKEAEILKIEVERNIKEKEEAEKLKQKCIEEEKRIEYLENTRIQSAEEILKLKKIKEELEKNKEQQSMIQKEKNINTLLADIISYRNLKTELESYSQVTEALLNELKEKENEIHKLKIEAEKAFALEEETLKSLKKSSNEKAECENASRRSESIKNLAEHLRGTLVPREKYIRTKTKTILIKPLIIGAGFLFILGILAYLLAPEKMFFFAGSFIAAVICIIFSIKKRTYEDASLLDDALLQARERWKNEVGEDIGTGYEGVLITLSRASERAGTAREKFEKTIAELNTLEQERQERTLQKQKANNKLEEAQRNLRRLLDETGSVNINDYSGKLEKKKNLIERKNELANKLNNALKEYNSPTPAELEGILTARISELREKITEKELPPNEIKAMENRLREVIEQLDKLQVKDKESIISINLDRGTVIGQYKGLNEIIANLAKNIQNKNIRLEEIKNELRAVQIAKELFSSLSDDSTLMFEQLSNEITNKFSALTTDKHKIDMNSFNSGTADIVDAYGLIRKEGTLSAGTRDAFLLASRLVLAQKSQDNAILVLDDPFLTLDKPRVQKALIVLKEFYNETKWQIIIFTKDEDTANQAKVIFGDEIKVHTL